MEATYGRCQEHDTRFDTGALPGGQLLGEMEIRPWGEHLVLRFRPVRQPCFAWSMQERCFAARHGPR